MTIFDGIRRKEPVTLDRFQLVLNKWGYEFLETRSEQYKKDHPGHRIDRTKDLKLGGDQGWGGTDVTPGDPASFWLQGRCECGKGVTHYFNNSPRMYAELDQIWVVRELVNTDIWGVDEKPWPPSDDIRPTSTEGQ